MPTRQYFCAAVNCNHLGILCMSEQNILTKSASGFMFYTRIDIEGMPAGAIQIKKYSDSRWLGMRSWRVVEK